MTVTSSIVCNTATEQIQGHLPPAPVTPIHHSSGSQTTQETGQEFRGELINPSMRDTGMGFWTAGSCCPKHQCKPQTKLAFRVLYLYHASADKPALPVPGGGKGGGTAI